MALLCSLCCSRWLICCLLPCRSLCLQKKFASAYSCTYFHPRAASCLFLSAYSRRSSLSVLSRSRKAVIHSVSLQSKEKTCRFTSGFSPLNMVCKPFRLLYSQSISAILEVDRIGILVRQILYKKENVNDMFLAKPWYRGGVYMFNMYLFPFQSLFYMFFLLSGTSVPSADCTPVI